MKKINILQLLTTSNVRGSENLVVNMLEQSHFSEYDYSICTLHPKGELHELTEEKGLQSFSLDVKYNYFVAGVRLWHILKKHQIDIVHVYGFRTDILCRLVIIFSKTRILISAIHSVYIECPKAIFWVDKILSPFVDLYISNSIRGAKFHQDKTSIDKKKYFIIHSGVNTSIFYKFNEKSYFRKEYNIPSNSIVITLLAGITGEKGHDIAVKSFARIIKVYGYNHCKLIFIGKDFIDGAVQNLASEKGVCGDIIFLGFCESKSVHQVMNSTDIFILPSLREGLPTAVIEAMSYSIPVVASDIGGTSELIVNGETGFLVSPGNVDSLTDKLLVLIKDGGKRTSMGAAARELVKSKFSLDQMTKSIEQKYYELYQLKYG
jgi:L-malate glycosyltransferase